MTEALRKVIRANRAGHRTALPSVCSAHPDVLRASLLLAETLDRDICIEATSNQVNQDGGYTGMHPAGFVSLVHEIADTSGVARERIHFGGDHLGPQAWRKQSPEAAMAKAHELVAAYAAAGFGKIHLDCSEGCKGEAAQLDDDVTAARSAELARRAAGAADDLLFVIGTEVPPPGGARMDEDGVIPATTPEAARSTLAAHADTFGDLTALIGGLVVQPGVEFSPMQVHPLPVDRDPGLLAALHDWPEVCLEAHSTDYQRPDVYPHLAELGFAFQKVGPALTFAYRQALYALDRIAAALGRDGAGLQEQMEALMCAEPAHWQSHYTGPDLALQRHYGYADRIRYYWPHPKAKSAVKRLFATLPARLPEPLVLDFVDAAALDRAETLPGPFPDRLILAYVQQALMPYFFDQGERLP